MTKMVQVDARASSNPFVGTQRWTYTLMSSDRSDDREFDVTVERGDDGWTIKAKEAYKFPITETMDRSADLQTVKARGFELVETRLV